MSEQNEVTGEMNTEPFSRRSHRFNRAADDRVIFMGARELGENCFKISDNFTGERSVKCASRTKDCVAFRHIDSELT
jgi:hypothetical protein